MVVATRPDGCADAHADGDDYEHVSTRTLERRSIRVRALRECHRRDLRDQFTLADARQDDAEREKEQAPGDQAAGAVVQERQQAVIVTGVGFGTMPLPNRIA